MASSGHGSEQRRQAQDIRLVVDTIPTLAWSARPDGSADFFNRRWLEYTGLSASQALEWGWRSTIHPDDLAPMMEIFHGALRVGEAFEAEGRLRRADGAYRWFLFRGSPLLDKSGKVTKWYGTNTDIEDRKRAEEALRFSETKFRLTLDSIPGLVCTMSPAGEVELLNRRVLEYFGKTTEELRGWATSDAVHPDDLPRVLTSFRNSVETGHPYDIEHRCRRADGIYRWFQVRALPVRDANGSVKGWYILLTDIDDRKRSEEALRASERELRLIFETIPGFVWTMSAAGEVDVVSQQMLEYFGKTLEELKDWSLFVHSEDRADVVSYWKTIIDTGQSYNVEHRLRRADGVYRWFHGRGLPLKDAEGQVVRWYNLLTDIDERKRAEEEIKRLKDRLHDENVALREEIDQAFMFDEIVGSSKALRNTVAQVARVAPTDSTVLITGETGTGKELVARAIHKRSHRSARAFVAVNCAAVPRDLIASELFGHEKGAFTGATQQRLGRFELAGGGTIFLDEVGELPAETQIALLRVLQEHEFERVGGNRSIQTDVRMIAATNRDLEVAIAAGAFRRDLFYRLNVFPIEVPALRERPEDIPVLVEYFIDRFARKVGKIIRGVTTKSLELLRSYPWPGNIRELQNVIERSVILCDTANLSVEESWLMRQALAKDPKSRPQLSQKLAAQEKEMIEAALRGSAGRVSGPSGAAAKLGIPGSTLESKIRSLKINKNRFKVTDSSTDRL